MNGGHPHGIGVPELSGNGLTIPAHTSWETAWAGDHQHLIFIGGTLTSLDGDHAHGFGPLARTVTYGGPDLSPFLGPSDFSIPTGDLGLAGIGDHTHTFAAGFHSTTATNAGSHSNISPTWTTETTFAYTPFACRNGRDDDGDGTVDHGQDLGCTSPSDDSEKGVVTGSPPFLTCDDGVDNDGDTLVDYPDDPGCFKPASYTESPRCSDGIDNDGDAQIDYPADPECTKPWDVSEGTAGAQCGIGFELVFVLPPLMRLYRRRRA